MKAVFGLRLLAMAGYMPDLVGCKVCGCYEAESMYFLPLTGDLMCGDCLGDAPPDEMVRLRLSPGVLAAMRHILYSEAGKVFNFTLSEEELRYLGDICEYYAIVQLDTRLSSLSGVSVLSGSGNTSTLGASAPVLSASGTSTISGGGTAGTSKSGTLPITGTGSGHNLGMRPYGDKAMAEIGAASDAILEFY